jgi:ribonuclease-3
MSGFLQRIEQLLDHKPRDVDRAAAALTHPSYLHQYPEAGGHNQRLEFLGDAVLGLIVAEEMFRRVGADEGRLTQGRAAVVSTIGLAAAARRLMLGDLLRMSDAAQRAGDNQRDKVLADAFESMIALAYEELGLEGARSFVLRHLADELDAAVIGGALLDNPKSELSERCQETDGKPPEYRLVGKTGSDHAPQHQVAVLWGQKDAVFGEGCGMKSAQMSAAKKALSAWFGASE